MAQGPLEKAIRRRKELLTRNSELRAEIDKNTAEIAQLDSALAVLRRFAPAGLPGFEDEDVSDVYGDLTRLTIPDAAATILFKRGEALTTREILDVMVKAGKLADSQNSHISLLQALKRNTRRFRRVNNTWELIETRHPVFAVIDSGTG